MHTEFDELISSFIFTDLFCKDSSPRVAVTCLYMYFVPHPREKSLRNKCVNKFRKINF